MPLFGLLLHECCVAATCVVSFRMAWILPKKLLFGWGRQIHKIMPQILQVL